jgi:hypothetical protein
VTFRRGDSVEVERVDGSPDCRGQILQKHPPGVAVGGDGVDRQVPLGVGKGREVARQTNSPGVHSISLSETGSSLPGGQGHELPGRGQVPVGVGGVGVPQPGASSESTRSGSPPRA